MRGLVKRWRKCREYTNRMAVCYEKAAKLFTSGSEIEIEIYNDFVTNAAHCRSISGVLDMFMSEYSNEELKDMCLSVEKYVSGMRVV